MKWQTHISGTKNGSFVIRNQPITELLATCTFSQSCFFILKGNMPTPDELRIFDTLLVSMLDHGPAVPSAFMPRVSISVGNSMNTALAAGLLGIGDHHGGAIERAMQTLYDPREPSAIVTDALAKKERLSGYGHKVYKDRDPRAEALIAFTQTLSTSHIYLEKSLAIEQELAKQKPTTVLPINIDGVTAGLLCDLGFDASLGKAFFALARIPGMMAHAAEEQKNEKPYRRFDEEDCVYTS